MSDNIGQRGIPATNTYDKPGIQSKRQLNSIGNMLSKLSVDGGDVFSTGRGMEIQLPKNQNQNMYRVNRRSENKVRIYNGI